MNTIFRMLVALAAVTLGGFVTTAQAATDCGLNNGKRATGEPIPIGAVSTTSGIFSFRETVVLDFGKRLAMGPTRAVLDDPLVRRAYLGSESLDVQN